jgi:hypothetical protein
LGGCGCFAVINKRAQTVQVCSCRCRCRCRCLCLSAVFSATMSRDMWIAELNDRQSAWTTIPSLQLVPTEIVIWRLFDGGSRCLFTVSVTAHRRGVAIVRNAHHNVRSYTACAHSQADKLLLLRSRTASRDSFSAPAPSSPLSRTAAQHQAGGCSPK